MMCHRSKAIEKKHQPSHTQKNVLKNSAITVPQKVRNHQKHDELDIR